MIQNTRTTGLYFELTLPIDSSIRLEVVSFTLDEAYSQLFTLDIQAVSRYQTLDFSTLLGKNGTLRLYQAGVLLREITGLICHFDTGDSGFHHTFYHLTLSPQLYRLTLRHNCRIFQKKSLRHILAQLLDEHRIVDYQFAFRFDHPVREYCVQYRETDFDFLQRLTAEEGILFTFEQTASSRNSVVFYDDVAYLNATKAAQICLPYRAPQQGNAESSISTFRFGGNLRPYMASLNDFNFKSPLAYLHQHKERAYQPFDNEAGNIRHEHYDYPGRFKTSEWGQAFTRYRIDSLRRDVHCGEGASNAAILSPGRFLKLTDHPKADFNQLWQITAVRHHGEQPQSLEEGHQQTDTSQGCCYLTNHFHVIPRAQSWRINLPQKPQIHGTQAATVVGPPGEEIFTDNYGRVKVQFHWDREGQHNDRSSCWIRVASHWAGEGWGMLSLPRIGQEVLISFQEGAPDQPIIIGRVYNGTHLPPGHLPQSRTQMYIKSKTYKGKGYNSMMFDDAPHNELFEMHAERDMATLVKHDQRNHIRHDRHLTVDNTQTTTIGRGRTTQITTGNDVKSVLAGSNLETVSLLKSTVAKEIFQYGKDHIELEVGEQTSITLDNEKILLRFGQSTILMNAEGIWLDGKHIGMMETDINKLNNTDKSISKGEIIDLYWSYGNTFSKLDNISRHYVDLNLHIVTQNYHIGSSVEVNIDYETNEGIKTLLVSAIVTDNGEAIAKNIFKNKTILI